MQDLTVVDDPLKEDGTSNPREPSRLSSSPFLFHLYHHLVLDLVVYVDDRVLSRLQNRDLQQRNGVTDGFVHGVHLARLSDVSWADNIRHGNSILIVAA